MSRKDSIDDCRRGKDARNLASRLANQSDDIEYGNGGKHAYVKTSKGKMPIPRGSWGKGLFHAVVKQWKLLGLPILLVAMMFGEKLFGG